MIGIYDCFGYGVGYDVPFAERYRLIREAGFDSVMVWWSDRFDRGAGYREDVRLARDAGLIVENLHAPVHEQNTLFLDTPDGAHAFRDYLQSITDCATYRVPTLVIHLPDDSHPLTPTGMERLTALIAAAEERDVRIAFENLGNIRNLARVLKTFPSGAVGLCYDSCHHQNYAPEEDLLARFGSRLMALHLHDNGGPRYAHRLPFDGGIDWTDVMCRIARTGYRGVTALEPMNWEYGQLSIREFLALAFEKAQALDRMRTNLSVT